MDVYLEQTVSRGYNVIEIPKFKLHLHSLNKGVILFEVTITTVNFVRDPNAKNSETSNS
jgi:hypothetical protein